MKRKAVVTLVVFAILALVVNACASSAPAPAAPKAAEPQAAAPKAAEPQAAPKAAEPKAAEPKAKEVAAPAAPAAAPKAEAKPPQKVKIAIPALSPTFSALFIGKNAGFFKDEGIDPEILVLKGDLMIPAMMNGEIDYAATFGRNMQAGALGEPIRLLMIDVAKAPWRILLGKGITEPQQVKGKSVAIGMKGGGLHYATVLGIKKMGLDPDKDVSWVVIPQYPDVLTALINGAVGAGTLEAVETHRAKQAGLKQAVFTGDLVELPSGGVGTTTKRIQENPDQVKRVLKVFLKSMAWAKDHKAEVAEILMKELKADKELATILVEDQLSLWAFDGILSDKGLEAFMDTMKMSTGPLKDVTVDQAKKALDYTLLKAAQKELGMIK